MADMLDRQILEEVGALLAALRTSAVGDSPIERLFFLALSAAAQFGISVCRHVVVPDDDAHLQRLLATPVTETIIVTPQAQIAGWCVDFLVRAWSVGKDGSPAAWRILIVECDGNDFHERTKEQAARDRSRDRNAQIRGSSILRFTGSEIHANPLGCALQVSRWAMQGWP